MKKNNIGLIIKDEEVPNSKTRSIEVITKSEDDSYFIHNVKTRSQAITVGSPVYCLPGEKKTKVTHMKLRSEKNDHEELLNVLCDYQLYRLEEQYNRKMDELNQKFKNEYFNTIKNNSTSLLHGIETVWKTEALKLIEFYQLEMKILKYNFNAETKFKNKQKNPTLVLKRFF